MGCTAPKIYTIAILLGSSRTNSIHASIVKYLSKINFEDQLQIRLIIPNLDRIPIYNDDEAK